LLSSQLDSSRLKVSKRRPPLLPSRTLRRKRQIPKSQSLLLRRWSLRKLMPLQMLRSRKKLSQSQRLMLKFKFRSRWTSRPTTDLLFLLKLSRSQAILTRSRSLLLWKKLLKKQLKKPTSKELPYLAELMDKMALFNKEILLKARLFRS